FGQLSPALHHLQRFAERHVAIFEGNDNFFQFAHRFFVRQSTPVGCFAIFIFHFVIVRLVHDVLSACACMTCTSSLPSRNCALSCWPVTACAAEASTRPLSSLRMA